MSTANWTVPAGTGCPAAAVTVAVTVTGWPNTPGSADDDTLTEASVSPRQSPALRNPALILSDVDAAGTLFGYVDSANLPGYGIAYANGTYTTFQDPERPGQGRPRRQHRRPRGQVSGRIKSGVDRPGDLHLRR